MVAYWIGAAYWFTASTSFAQPPITIARSLTDTFAGIRPIDAPAFIAAFRCRPSDISSGQATTIRTDSNGR